MDQDSEFAELPRVLNSDAITLAHASSADARGVVVVFHGMTGTPSEMSLLASHLYDKGFHVYVPRLSGHGTTVQDLSVTSVASWMEDTDSAFQKARELSGGKLFVVGLSFGALLAISLVSRHRLDVNGLVLAAPPIRLASAGSFLRLSALSLLPEYALSHLWTIKKRRRKKNYLFVPHSAYSFHSAGGLSRLFKIRREVLRELRKVTVPILVLQDPFDHHLAATSAFRFTDRLSGGPASVSLLPGAEHEVFIGHQHERACHAVSKFFLQM